jgi:DNA-binding protein HU-beta
VLENQNIIKMTKADIIAKISDETGLERLEVQKTVESFMATIKKSMAEGNDVFLRGFGSFIVKERAEKTGRNISKNETIIIPAHNIPAFKPAKVFVEEVKTKVAVK